MDQIVTSVSSAKVRTPNDIAHHSSGMGYSMRIVDQPVFQCRSSSKRWAVNVDTFFVAPASKSTVATADDWRRFRLLADNWRKERGITSSSVEMAMCQSYQRIIGMGARVVPMILRELTNEQDDPDHWFWALEMITGADPVPVDAYGDTVRMADAWLTWAKGKYAW